MLFASLLTQSSQLLSKEIDSPSNLNLLTLEDLLKIKVSTASKSTLSLNDAPAIINVITANEIQKMGATSLIDILSIMPGFTPLRQLKSDRVLVVRGLALKDGVLVLVNGVPVNDAFDGGYEFYERPVDDIQRIEIIRGPGSALYGSYAVSAVIHIFTQSASLNDKQYRISLGSGSFEEKRLAINIKQDLSEYIDDLTIAGSFSYFDSEGDKLFIKQDSIFRAEPAEFLPPLTNPTLTPTMRQEAMEKFSAHLNVQIKALNINFNHNQIITSPPLSHEGLVTEVNQTIKESTRDNLSIQYKHYLSKQLTLTSKAYSVVNQSKLFGQSQPPLIYADENQNGLNEYFISGIIENFSHKTQTNGVELELNYNPQIDHDLLVGLVYDETELSEVEKFANVTLIGRGPSVIFPVQDVTSEFMPKGVSRKFLAMYIQDYWRVNNKTNITTGIRYGDYNDFGTTLNPRISLNYQFSENFYSKFLFGQAFKPPAFFQLFDGTPTLSEFRKRGNVNLKPTEITTYESQLGYNFSNKLQTSLTIFENNTSNEIFYDSTSGVEQWQNSGKRNSKGVEFELRGAFAGFESFFVNYSYQKTTGVKQGSAANIHPLHRLNAGGTFHFSDSISSGFLFSYFSSPLREKDEQRPRVDDKGRDEIEASVGLIDDIPLPGRSIRLTVSYDF